MKTYNLKESLIQMDRETDFEYTLTDLYEACQLTEDKKRELVKYIDAKDPVGMNAMLCNEVGVMTENVSDDIPDDEMPELEGWSPDMSECPACGDFTFNSRSGKCTACSYTESLNESFEEGDMVWVKPSNKPGRVVSVKGDTVEVEIMGGKDPDRRDTFYTSDLEMEKPLNESDEPDYSCYNLTDDQIEKVKFIEKNLNTPVGYKAYYDLMKEITDEGGCMDVFYDLSADFYWDHRLNVALTKLALADNRPDLADPDFLPGGIYADYMEHDNYKNILSEDVNTQNLEATLRAAAENKFAEMGYEGDFIDEYFGIKLEDTEDNRVKVTVWGELSYEESSELADVLNYIVAEEDPDAYFDHETSGRIVAYIRKDQSEDIPDEALVAEWSEKFNSCTTWEQLKDVYGEFYNIRDDLNNGTHRALYDIIDKKIDELKPVEESLTEDAEETPAAIYSMLDASDSYVDNDDYPEGASEEEIIKIAEANPDCMKVTKWVDGMEGPDEVIWERPVDTWYVSKYEGGSAYEPAEGGYYYETLALVDKETFPSKVAAQKRLAELAAEAEKEGEEVVALTNDFFRIKTGRYIGDCEEYHVEAKEGAHASGKKVYEGLNEAILNEINSPEEKPYSAAEIEKEIKSLTQNFTASKDTLKCGFKEENDAAVALLKKHYKNVNSEKHGQWFELTFSDPISVKEAYVENPRELMRNKREDGAEFDEETGEWVTIDYNDAGKPQVMEEHNSNDLSKNHLNYVIHNVVDYHRSYSPKTLTPEDVAWACTSYDSEFTYDEYLSAINKYDALQDYIEADKKKKYGGSVYRSSEIINNIENDWSSSIEDVYDSGKGYIVVKYCDGCLDDDTAEDREDYINHDFDDCRIKVTRVGPNTLHVVSKGIYEVSQSSKHDSLTESNQFRDDNGKVNASKWYASKYPDDSVGIEQLDGLYLDDLVKDRKGIDHCDTQVRDRVNQQLDKYIPIKEDVQNAPVNKSINTYNITFYMDSLDDNVMSGPTTTKKIQAASEEEAKKKLIDSSTDKYYIPTVTKVELVEGAKLSEGTKQKRIACTTEFDNGNVIHNDWQEISDEEAEELAKQRSIENPDKVYYVKYDDIMNPCSDYKWKNGQCINESKSINEAMIYTDTNGFLGDPGETYTMSQFRRMWQDKDNDPVMSGYDSFEEWVGETISQMDASEEPPEVAPSGRGGASCKIWTDVNGVMGDPGNEYTLTDLASYWEDNNGSDPVLAKYEGDWKQWLDDTLPQMEEHVDSSLNEEWVKNPDAIIDINTPFHNAAIAKELGIRAEDILWEIEPNGFSVDPDFKDYIVRDVNGNSYNVRVMGPRLNRKF